MSFLLKLLALIVCVTASSQAAMVLQSSFDTDAENWSVGDFFGSSFQPVTDYNATGGVSGGYVSTTDVYGYTAFRAPASWLGDQSRLYGGALTFQLRAAESDGFIAPLVVLGSGALRLQYRDIAPGTDWTQYRVLLAPRSWEIANGSGMAGSRMATTAELRHVLGNLEYMAINADWHTGDDLVGLDNLEYLAINDDGNTGDDPVGPNNPNVTTPEPSSALVALSGMAALGIAAFRRRSRL